MRILALGDIHGRDNWRNIVDKEMFGRVVFIGDYFDSWDLSADEQIENFKNIIAYKKSNMDKVVLLFGNHDYHYLRNANESYSGFQPAQKFDIGELLHDALDKDLMQMCYVYKEFLFSHAGVTNTWCRNNDIDMTRIGNSINDLFKYKPNAFRFTSVDKRSAYGDEICQPPTWVRPDSCRKDGVDDFMQIVGHTERRHIALEHTPIVIDTLGTSGEYLIIENGIITVHKL